MAATQSRTSKEPASTSNALDAFRREWLEEIQHVDRRVRAEETPEQAKLRQARECYEAGAHYEREGQIALAMQCYREAFQLDPELGNRAGPGPAGPSAAGASSATGGAVIAAVDAAAAAIDDLELEPTQVPEALLPASHLQARLVQVTPAPAIEVANEAAQSGQTHLSALPAEVLVQILRHCDVVSVERAARACKLLYLLSRDVSVWRPRCLATHSEEYCLRMLPECEGNWRILAILVPRVRDDGLYICKQSYYRRGSKRCRAGSVYDQMFEIVYWRYLRFYLDGTMVAATTAEHPASARQSIKAGAKNARTGWYSQRHREVTGFAQDHNAVFQYRMTLGKAQFSRVRRAAAPRLRLDGYSSLNSATKQVTEYDAFTGLEYTFVSFEGLARLRPPPPTLDDGSGATLVTE